LYTKGCDIDNRDFYAIHSGSEGVKDSVCGIENSGQEGRKQSVVVFVQAVSAPGKVQHVCLPVSPSKPVFRNRLAITRTPPQN
jgi:hypothetical protein